VWPRASPVPISIEEGIAESLQVGLGDELVLMSRGSHQTVVRAARSRLAADAAEFFVVFPLGVLEDAPSFHIMVRGRAQRQVSANAERRR